MLIVLAILGPLYITRPSDLKLALGRAGHDQLLGSAQLGNLGAEMLMVTKPSGHSPVWLLDLETKVKLRFAMVSIVSYS